MTPEYIVIHTAAFSGRDCDANRIDRWHKDRNWSGIGYHYVILNDRHSSKPDGLVEKGRKDDRSGAHAKGINGKSLGICCIGHGDQDPFTAKQIESLNELVNTLMAKFSIPLDKVIGHRELNLLVDKGLLEKQYRTSKSCPGKKIDMNEVRQQIGSSSALEPESSAEDNEIKSAIETLKKYKSRYPNAQDELGEFITHPEVIQITE